MGNSTTEYPVKLTVDYPDRPLDRLTSFFRLFTMIPIAVILWLIMGPALSWGENADGWRYGIGTAALLFLPTLLMILFQQKYPRWWYEWNVGLTKFCARVSSYLCLMSDKYPSTEEEQWVHIEILYPDVKKELNRWYPLVKWFLAIPHYVVLIFIGIAACACVVIAWFAILFTGKYPRGLFDFVAGFLRWDLRVTAYAFLLVTDKYPPFSLD